MQRYHDNWSEGKNFWQPRTLKDHFFSPSRFNLRTGLLKKEVLQSSVISNPAFYSDFVLIFSVKMIDQVRKHLYGNISYFRWGVHSWVVIICFLSYLSWYVLGLFLWHTVSNFIEKNPEKKTDLFPVLSGKKIMLVICIA